MVHDQFTSDNDADLSVQLGAAHDGHADHDHDNEAVCSGLRGHR